MPLRQNRISPLRKSQGEVDEAPRDTLEPQATEDLNAHAHLEEQNQQ